MLLLRLACSVVIALVGLGCEAKSKPRALPNVLLISLDACRADHLTPYGYKRDTSPFLAELASKGVLFTEAFVNTHATAQSHTSILSGLYQEYHKVLWTPVSESNNINTITIPHEVTLLPEVMKRHGYVTLGVTGGGWMAGGIGFSRGFTEFTEASDPKTATARLVGGIRGHIDDDRPIFVFFHTYQIHSPYWPPEEYRNLFGTFASSFIPTTRNLQVIRNSAARLSAQDLARTEALYDADIRYTDDALRALWARLEKIGFLKNYLVIITSDHGEEFGDHGRLLHPDQLFDEILRVPLIVVGTSIPRGKVDDRLASSVDIVPTILKYAGIAYNTPLAGRDLLGRPSRPRETEAVFAQWGNALYAIRTRDWKLIYTAADRTFELYSLRDDPDEKHNVADAHPNLVKELWRRLRDWRASAQSNVAPGRQIPMDPEQRERLKALGYLQ